jgi:putative ABC transport system permease protein
VRTTLAENGQSQLDVVTGQKLIDENKSQIEKALGFLNKGLLIFGFVALIVGAFIIYNTFSIVVAQRTREMALLRAIGASTRQVLVSIIGESVVVGILASAVGILAGIGIAIALRAVMSAIGIDLPGTGTVVPVTAVVGPARRHHRDPVVGHRAGARAFRHRAAQGRHRTPGQPRTASPSAAPLAIGSASCCWVVREGQRLVRAGRRVLQFIGVFVLGPLYARFTAYLIGSPIARVKGITGQLARENAGRNPRRTSVTASALMIGVALVGFITVFAASAKTSFLGAIDDQITSDYVINSGGGFGGIGLSPALGAQIARLPEIEASTPIRVGTAELNHKVDFIAAGNPETAGSSSTSTRRRAASPTWAASGVAVSKSRPIRTTGRSTA